MCDVARSDDWIPVGGTLLTQAGLDLVPCKQGVLDITMKMWGYHLDYFHDSLEPVCGISSAYINECAAILH